MFGPFLGLLSGGLETKRRSQAIWLRYEIRSGFGDDVVATASEDFAVKVFYSPAPPFLLVNLAGVNY